MRKSVIFKLQYFFIFLAMGAVAPFFNLYLKKIGFSGTEIGIIGSMSPIVMLFSQPFWGLICDRYNARKKALLIAVFLSAILNLSYLLTRNFYSMIVIAIVVNFFSSAINPILDSSTLTYLGENSNDYGKFRVWGSIGYAFSTLIIGYFLQIAGISNMFYAYAAFMLITFVYSFKMPEVQRANVNRGKGHVSGLLCNDNLMIFLGIVFISQLAVVISEAFFGIYMNTIKAPEGLIGLAWFIAALCELPVFIYSSVLLEKFGSKKLLAFAMAVFAIRIFLYSVLRNPYAVLIVQSLSGLDFAPFYAAAVTFVNEHAPENLKTTAQTLFNLIAYSFSSIAGNLLGGRLYDIFGIQIMYRYFSALVIIALFLLLIFVREKAGLSDQS